MKKLKKQQQQQQPHHSRTKSDNIYNRASLSHAVQYQAHQQALPNQQIQSQIQQKNIIQTQQSKRIQQANAKHMAINHNQPIMKNNYIQESQAIHYSQQKPSHQKHQSMGSSNQYNINPNLYQGGQEMSKQRKVQNSVHSTKKPIQHAQTNQINQNLKDKKTTREKYQELKALYNDLLERHQALTQQQLITSQSSQNQQSYNQLQQIQKVQQQLQAINFSISFKIIIKLNIEINKFLSTISILVVNTITELIINTQIPSEQFKNRLIQDFKALIQQDGKLNIRQIVVKDIIGIGVVQESSERVSQEECV